MKSSFAAFGSCRWFPHYAQALWSPYTKEDHASLALLRQTVAETFDKVVKAGSVREGFSRTQARATTKSGFSTHM